jgi:hypothetical protein
VVNTLAVKRAALRGGAWSTAGKSVEKNLMTVLCRLFSVPPQHFDQTQVPESMREVDFYLINNDRYFRCEVKLMGKGNPESADAIFARESDVFVADKLSDLNKRQADMLKVHWVELRNDKGYLRFGDVLTALDIQHKIPEAKFEEKLSAILDEAFQEM